MLPLILASASPRRAELLKTAGLSFSVIPSDGSEPGAAAAEDAALNNAFVKALDVSGKRPDALVLGADTVIELDGKIFGKPGSPEDAFNMLKNFSGKTHLVTTGCAILSRKYRICIRFAESSCVTFRELSDETIREYLEKTQVLDKAGSYAVQENGELLISGIRGDRDNIIGLPKRAIDSIKAVKALFD